MTLTVTPTTIPDGRVGEAFSHQMAASGGTAPYTFEVSAGALPAGLTISEAGLISGTPTTVTADVADFTITATDSAGSPDTGDRVYADMQITAQNVLTNSLVDAAAALVPTPYGPLTRVTDVETGQISPNIGITLELTTAAGTTVKCTYLQLKDAQAIQRQIALATGRDYIMHTVRTQIAALKTYFDGIAEVDGEGYTQAEFDAVMDDLREIHQISGYYEKISNTTYWS